MIHEIVQPTRRIESFSRRDTSVTRKRVKTNKAVQNDLLHAKELKKPDVRTVGLHKQFTDQTLDSRSNREWTAKDKTLIVEDNTFIYNDGSSITLNDCVYLLCDPPTEPYYLARVMEFTKSDPCLPTVDCVRVNWFYRPRDIQKQHSDSRLLFATMHSDISPLHSIRGKCRVEHKSEIIDQAAFKKLPDCFYYDRLFDKFMRRQYEVIPVNQVINVPDSVKQVLQQKWKYVVVEVNRSKELAMDHRACKRCNDWCASKDSVRCVHCSSDFHLRCLQPPLPRKPTRGFAWSCTPCSRAEARRLRDSKPYDLDMLKTSPVRNAGRSSADCDKTSEFSDEDEDKEDKMLIRGEEALPDQASLNQQLTAERKPSSKIAELWPYRYLGIHCNVADAVDQDDRIYPRAASRIGPRYQANVQDWAGHPIEYFSRLKRPIKRTAKAMIGKRSDERANLDNSHTSESASDVSSLPRFDRANDKSDSANNVMTQQLSTLFAHERPAWLLERPSNYLNRGEGNTSSALWTLSTGFDEAQVELFLTMARPVAQRLGINSYSQDYLDVVLKVYSEQHYELHNALSIVRALSLEDFGSSTFSANEKTLFEESVKKNGNELAQVAQDVGSKSVAECIRYYYLWKKTARGARIWQLSEARQHKSEKETGARANQFSKDLGGFSGSQRVEAVEEEKFISICKYCHTTTSETWQRAPGTAIDAHKSSVLCDRCAELWQKYAIVWQIPEGTSKESTFKGGHRGKKRKDEDSFSSGEPTSDVQLPEASAQESTPARSDTLKAKKIMHKSLASSLPRCSVCCIGDETTYLDCKGCGLRVHLNCWQMYDDCKISDNWICDVCSNDRAPTASQAYACVLCPVRGDLYSPRSYGSLKRTSGNNWSHLSCAAWHTHTTFAQNNSLDVVHNITAIPFEKWQSICAICQTNKGACLSCSTCSKLVHVECALRAGYILAFDLQPIKSSQLRRDSLSLIRIGTTAGLLSPVIHCPSHDLRRIPMHSLSAKVSPLDISILSMYIKTYKRNHSVAAPNRSIVRRHDQYLTCGVSRIIKDRTSRIRDSNALSNDQELGQEEKKQCPLEQNRLQDIASVPQHLGKGGDTDRSGDLEEELCSRCSVSASPYWFHNQIGNKICVRCKYHKRT